MSGRHSSECRYTSQAAALGGNVASVNGALARMGSPAGSASGRSAALSAHQTPAVTPEYQRIVGRGQPVDVAVEFISFPT